MVICQVYATLKQELAASLRMVKVFPKTKLHLQGYNFKGIYMYLTRAGQNSVAIFVRKPKKKALKRLKKGANFCMPPALQDGKQFFAAAMWEFLFINLQ